MALFRRKNDAVAANGATAMSTQPVPGTPVTGSGKNRPTPTRREAEAARRARVQRNLSGREARRENARKNRVARMKLLSARDATPEKVLIRDYVDARFSIGELLLPSLLVIVMATFLGPVWPQAAVLSTVAMYVFLLLVIADSYVMWRGFKRVLAERLPSAPTRGLLMYGVNRCIQIRRFRMPPPRIKRGEAY